VEKFFDLNHLEESEMSYMRHFIHGFHLGLWLLFATILSFVNSFLNFKKIQNIIHEIIKTIYLGLMSRWFEDNFNQKKPQKPAMRVRMYRKEYVEKIQKGIIKPNSNIKNSCDLLIMSISSIVHSIIPQILVNHAAKKLIKIYFNNKIVEEINEK